MKLDFIKGIANVPRGSVVSGKLGMIGDTDTHRFEANQGEVWAIDADRISGDMDPKIVIRHCRRSGTARGIVFQRDAGSSKNLKVGKLFARKREDRLHKEAN